MRSCFSLNIACWGTPLLVLYYVMPYMEFLYDLYYCTRRDASIKRFHILTSILFVVVPPSPTVCMLSYQGFEGLEAFRCFLLKGCDGVIQLPLDS